MQKGVFIYILKSRDSSAMCEKWKSVFTETNRQRRGLEQPEYILNLEFKKNRKKLKLKSKNSAEYVGFND